MKSKLLLALSTLLCAGIFAENAEAHPAMFSDLSIEQAQAQANKEGKLVLVDFTASWCGPCHKMDETTWSSPEVEKWIKDNVVAVQIDVDKEKAVAESLAVHAMPTILIYQPKQTKEFEREVGYKDQATLIAWLTNAKAGKSHSSALAEQFKTVEGKGGKEEVDVRYKLAQSDFMSGNDADATSQFTWLWNNIKKEFMPMIGVRNSFMADTMQKLASHYEPAKTQFLKLRDETPADDRDDWMVLNKVVGEENKTLDWFDSVKNDKTKKSQLDHLSKPFKMFLISKGRFADVGRLCKDPLAELKQDHDMSIMVKKVSNGFDLFPTESTSLYACLLAAGRTADAKAVQEESFKLDDSQELKDQFAKASEQIKQLEKPHDAVK